jgi:hypothetical protein
MTSRNSVAVALAILAICGDARAQHASVTPSKMPRVGAVDERFQSYNVEMVEVTGGRFWRPYRDLVAPAGGRSGAATANMEAIQAALFQQRPPIDLHNSRLRKLAAALGPAYVRVSGTWANNTYFHDAAQPAPASPPQGFGGVLTRDQWKSVVEFARETDARLVTSFAISPSTRDAAGKWTPDQARKLLDYTESLGVSIAAAEFMNEPTFADQGSAPAGYDAAAFARDLAVFVPWLRQASPRTLLLGPGGVGEGISIVPAGMALHLLPSEDLLKATGPVFDAFSYHSYAQVSRRCAGAGTPQTALLPESLARTDRIEQFYAGLRDRFLPGKPIWLTETADAACGGNPWDSTFLDSFRYLDQLGRLARFGVQVNMHNTLASSDYGLLDDDTYLPRPNYWAALLWRHFMGATVLDPGITTPPAVRLYAHCLRDEPGGVALLAINTDRAATYEINFPAAAERYTLSAGQLEDRAVQLNGAELKLADNDALPALTALATAPGRITFAPGTITFVTVANAGNSACR